MDDARIYVETTKKERAARKQFPLGESMTVAYPPKLTHFEQRPTYGMSPLTAKVAGLREEALILKRSPSAAVRRTEYAEQFDMDRINALALEERQMLRACGLDQRGRLVADK